MLPSGFDSLLLRTMPRRGGIPELHGRPRRSRREVPQANSLITPLQDRDRLAHALNVTLTTRGAGRAHTGPQIFRPAAETVHADTADVS